MTQTMSDVETGAMKGPWRFEDVRLDDKLLSRRMPVREEREAGFRTRVTDDCTESGINLATQAQEKLRMMGWMCSS